MSVLHSRSFWHGRRESNLAIGAQRCRCYYKLGEWQSSAVIEAGYATRTLSEETITQILDVYQCATLADRLWARVRQCRSAARMRLTAAAGLEGVGLHVL